jgi:hypothetical protein
MENCVINTVQVTLSHMHDMVWGTCNMYSCGWHKPDWFFAPVRNVWSKKQKKPGNFGVKQGKNHPNHSTLDLKR